MENNIISDAKGKVETGISENQPSGNGNGKENQEVHTISVSIKGVLKGIPRDIPVADEEISEDDVVKNLETLSEEITEITEEDIQKAWQAYADSIEDSQPRIYSTLKQHKPTMPEPGKIRLELISDAQRENFVQRIKPELTKYLQENLANIEYVFETNLLSNETALKKVYTDHDKLEFMIRKNAALDLMKKRFNLDFDS